MQNMEVTEALSYPAFIFFFSSFTWLDILIFYQYLGRARDSILREVNLKYEKDPSLLAEIIFALPKKMESTLNQHKNRLLGSLPKTLDDFDPSSLIAKLEGGDKILVMDSNRDLPENWKDIDMKETFGVVEEASDDINPSNGGSDDCATDDASSSDEGATSDEATAPADVDEDDNEEYQDVAANSTINVENAKKPKRVLIFTTVVMLGLLAVCKNGSVDGTFKAMTRKWKQLFIYMVYYRGSFLPVAFGWLPNKHAISYHFFLLLLLLKFRENQVGIIDLYGRGSLKLMKIKLDFELAIHRAFETLFKLKDCYFHFSQAAWRKVQKGGMVVSYMSEKKFRDFIRSVVALAFLPLNQIEAAIDELKAVEFEKDSPAYEQMTKFREEHLEYIESTWLYGSFQPKLWNQWKKSRNLTNNHNEGYNSRINKILSVFHPNPFVLVCMLVKELGRAEVEALWIKAGNPKKTKMSTLYEKLVFRRESPMEQFERGELPRLFFLQQMGAISLKSDKAASRMVLNIEDDKIESNISTSAAADVPVDAPVFAE